ncbi:hypothetical protein BH10BAC3_BH10BAC3_14910 [soil metagenome]
MQQNIISNIQVGAIQSDPPKIKTDKIDDAILNKQDDNSYEEPVTDNNPKKQDSDREENKQDDFEYTDTGEFEEASQITNTDPDKNEEFL